MIPLIALLLVISLLPACSVPPAADTQIPQEPVSYAQAEFSARELVEYRVSMDLCEEVAQADDGTPLASYQFHLPVLEALRGDGTVITEPQTELEEQAAEVVRTFNDKFGKWAAAEEFPEFVDSAAEDLALQQEWGGAWTPYTLELICRVYQTDCLVSVSAEYYSDTGGAHPNIWLLGWNFDLSSGTFFDTGVLAEDSTAFQTVVQQELLQQAAAVAAENGMEPKAFFWQDYEHIIADWGSYAVSFDSAGMTVAFSPYELAAYGAGPQEFQLSYEWLLPHLSGHGRTVLGLDLA